MVQQIRQDAKDMAGTAVARLPAPIYSQELIAKIADLIGCHAGPDRIELRRQLEAAGRHYLISASQTAVEPDPALGEAEALARKLLTVLDVMPEKQLERLYEAAQSLEDSVIADGGGVLIEIGAAEPYEEDGERGIEFLGLDDLPPLLGLLMIAIGRVQQADRSAKVDLRRLNAWARNVIGLLRSAGAQSCPVLGMAGEEPVLRQILRELLAPLHGDAVEKLEAALDRRWP